MKKILSVSVGSTTRDHTVQVELAGQLCELSRKGTNADFAKALELYREYDGKVDAFGVGGIEFYLELGKRKYYFREAKKIRKVVKYSKIGDGNGIKTLVAQRAFKALEEYLQGQGRTLKGLKGLKTQAVERYGMAKAMFDTGMDVTIGDFMFALGLPIPVHRLSTLHTLGAILLPFLVQMPFTWFYPLGEQQDEEPITRWDKYYNEADVIAGDFLQIRQYMPQDLTGKIIVTNTTTASNVQMLKERRLNILVTTTPRLEGRSFGTNVMEATLRALMEKPDPEITQQDFQTMMDAIPLKPNIEVLN
jgi:hypothetical protein